MSSLHELDRARRLIFRLIAPLPHAPHSQESEYFVAVAMPAYMAVLEQRSGRTSSCWLRWRPCERTTWCACPRRQYCLQVHARSDLREYRPRN